MVCFVSCIMKLLAEDLVSVWLIGEARLALEGEFD